MLKIRYAALLLIAAAASLVASQASPSRAAEAGFSAYGLGGSAFGAGVAPPPGTYVTGVGTYVQGDIGGGVTFGGIDIDVSLKIEEFIVGSLNLLYVPKETFLGGSPGVSVTAGSACVDLTAEISAGPLSGQRETDGCGATDTVPRAHLGWHHGDFHHLIYVQGLLPTGRYDLGFNPNIGLNRPAIDVGWVFTYIEPTTKFQFNGAIGYTTSFENDLTNYDSGDDLHFEWAIGLEVAEGLTLGVNGYDYRQITGDSGSGATRGAFKGKVDAIGPGLSYATHIGKIPFILGARHYQEFNAENRFDTSVTIISGTLVF